MDFSWIITGFILVPVVLAVFLVLIKRLYKTERERVENALISFVSPTGTKDNPQPSAMAQWIEAASAIFLERMETRIKAQTMQATGAVKRQENALMGEIVEGAIAAKSPLLGLVMQFAPEATKKLRKSPAMAQALMGVADMFKGGGGTKSNNGSTDLSQLY